MNMDTDEDRAAEIQRVKEAATRLAGLMNRHFVVDPDKERNFARNSISLSPGVASTHYDTEVGTEGYAREQA